MRDKLRRVILRPYAKGQGPVFVLTTYDTGKTDWRGQTKIAYLLTQREEHRSTKLFEGDDFAGSPLHADDSDASIACLLGFLTLKPGDTDADYFNEYSEAQRAYCDAHAEALSAEVDRRFGG